MGSGFCMREGGFQIDLYPNNKMKQMGKKQKQFKRKKKKKKKITNHKFIT